MNQTKLIIRILAGLYLLYSGYDLGKAVLEGTAEGIPIPIFAVLFLVCGAAFVITGILDLRKARALERAALKEEAEQAAQEPPKPEAAAEQRKKSISERARMTAHLGEEPEETGEDPGEDS